MFNLFRKRTAKEFVEEAKENYGVPEQKPMWTCPPESKEEPEKTYYRLGLTNNNRVSFQMGYSEITMNRAGCQQVIDQIAFFMNQLREDHVEETSDSDDTSTAKN